jgi:hypothetical protein
MPDSYSGLCLDGPWMGTWQTSTDPWLTLPDEPSEAIRPRTTVLPPVEEHTLAYAYTELMFGDHTPLPLWMLRRHQDMSQTDILITVLHGFAQWGRSLRDARARAISEIVERLEQDLWMLRA